jgi:molybdenum cofactor guanylyltransferase
MKHICSGIILAGGLNTRLDHKNKALMTVGGVRIIDRVYSVLAPLFDDLILVTNNPSDYMDLNLTIVTDIYQERSSLTGIHAGLSSARNGHGFCVACDVPFIKKELVELLLESVNPQIDVVVPRTNAGHEPLFAVYSKHCLNPIEHSLQRKEYKVQSFFSKMKVHKIRENVLRSTDPDLISFFNVNSQDRLEEAERLCTL